MKFKPTKKVMVAHILQALYLDADADKVVRIHKRHFNNLMREKKQALTGQHEIALKIINNKLLDKE